MTGPWSCLCAGGGLRKGPDRPRYDRIAMETIASYNSLVAVGDSFTEGMSDLLPDGSYRGWADVLAGRLATHAPGFATRISLYGAS